jgi:hypothetical protein
VFFFLFSFFSQFRKRDLVTFIESLIKKGVLFDSEMKSAILIANAKMYPGSQKPEKKNLNKRNENEARC